MLNVVAGSKQCCHAERLYAALVQRARQPVFFVKYGVPDTLDGRFDLLTLHAWLVLRRWDRDAPQAQALVDRIFEGFEEALRELGVGDIGAGRRLKTFADAFYGRLKAYDEAYGGARIEEALARNLYRGTPAPAIEAMAQYIIRAAGYMAVSGATDAHFGPLPGEEEQ